MGEVPEGADGDGEEECRRPEENRSPVGGWREAGLPEFAGDVGAFPEQLRGGQGGCGGVELNGQGELEAGGGFDADRVDVPAFDAVPVHHEDMAGVAATELPGREVLGPPDGEGADVNCQTIGPEMQRSVIQGNGKQPVEAK